LGVNVKPKLGGVILTTENVEQRLADIHDRAEQSKPIDVVEGSYTYYYLRDVPWLLELVGNILPSLVAKNIEIDRLQTRVRELESKREVDMECASCGDPNQVMR